MKFSSAVSIIFATFVASVSSHSTMSFPPTRGHPLNDNAAVQDFECIAAPLNGGSGCAPKEFPCGGYPRDKNIVTTFKAGEVFSVKFFNQNFPELKEEDKQKDQARHNGGLCEFALSYDGGESYTVIATYKKTCPDIFFDGWEVKIPENAPSCDDPGNCIFSWSWINAVGNREFYQNCADIKIEGNATEPLPIIDITRANLPPLFSEIITPEGDDLNSGNAVGSGPSKEDVEANLSLKIGNDNDDEDNEDEDNEDNENDEENDENDENGEENDENDENGEENDENDENGEENDENDENDEENDENNENDEENDNNENDKENEDKENDENDEENEDNEDNENNEEMPEDDEMPEDGEDDLPEDGEDELPEDGEDELPEDDEENSNDDENSNGDDDDDENSNDDVPCSEEGAMVCGEEGGVSSEFLTCDNGKLVSRSCPGILVCEQNGKSIFCNYPKRR